MNITELARILRITPQELRDYIPQFGFDIGQRAIKINRNTANKIIKKWPVLRRQIEFQKRKKQEEEDLKKQATIAEKKKIKVPSYITVRDFSLLSGLEINVILAELMKNGIFASLNEKIDYDTAWLISSELGLEVSRQKDDEQNISNKKENDNIKKIIEKEKDTDLQKRPPVIVVMGHVDHGKTKLLDSIRRTNIIEGEAGGITQHIGAYQVTRRKKLITFIDTPGHEAFTAMRSRGAKIADIAILVVAADDGVKQQTIEAFKIIESAKIPFVVAINKIDKDGANIEKTKQELSSKLNVIPEDWGGKIVCVPISALKEEGIIELLDIVLLSAETEIGSMKANPNAEAAGTIIESNIDKGSGPVATMLVQNGTIKIGDSLMLNKNNAGKVRCLYNYLGEKIIKAGPSFPAQIIGLKIMPEVGDILRVGKGIKIKYKKQKYDSSLKQEKIIIPQKDDEDVQKINIIIKSDVLGSAGAIEESLEKINTKKIKVKIIHKGLGNITDGDIKRAEASNGRILGFNVKILPIMEDLAREKKVKIKLYTIIYDLINDIKEEMQSIKKIELERKDLGKLKVLAIFKTEKNSQIIGGKVTKGKIESDSLVEVTRDDKIISEGKITKLQAGKQDVEMVDIDQECGIQYEGLPVIQENDKLIFYKMIEV